MAGAISFGMRARFAFSFILLLGGSIIYFGSIWHPLGIKHRADKAAGMAAALMETHNFAEAEEHLEAALALRPHDLRFVRLASRFYGEQKKPAAFTFFEELMRHRALTDADQFAFVELALVLKAPDKADPFVTRMLAQEPPSARAHMYAALLAEARGDMPTAITMARAALEREPRDSDFRLLLARMLIHAPVPEHIIEAKRLLFRVGMRNDGRRMQAIRLLASGPLAPIEARQLVAWLNEEKELSAGEYFLRADLMIRLDPGLLAKMAEEASAKFGKGAAQEREALREWMARHKLTDAGTGSGAKREG